MECGPVTTGEERVDSQAMTGFSTEAKRRWGARGRDTVGCGTS